MAYTFLFQIELDSSAAELGPEALRALILEEAQTQIPQNPMILQATLPESPKKKSLHKWTEEDHRCLIKAMKCLIAQGVKPVPSNVYKSLTEMGVVLSSRGVVASKIQRFRDFLITKSNSYMVKHFPGYLPEDKPLYLSVMYSPDQLPMVNENALSHFETQWAEQLVLEPEEEEPWNE